MHAVAPEISRSAVWTGDPRDTRPKANVPQMPCRPEPDVFMMVQRDRDRHNGLKRSALNRMALLATLRNSAAIGSAR
jgi:hypothetical protein